MAKSIAKTKNKSSIVGLKELRTDMEHYIARVDRGESFTVVRRSQPIFRLTPVDDEAGWETIVDFTEVRPRGVPAQKVLDVLRSIREKESANG